MSAPSPEFVTRNIEQFNALRSSDDWQVSDTVCLSGLRRAALVMLVKNADDVVGINLAHHYRLGFRRFFILDNNSDDRTAEIILAFKKRYPDAGVFYTTDYVPAHRQAVKTSAMAHFAEAYLSQDEEPIDWFFPIDADEFIVCCTKQSEPATQKFEALLQDPQAQVLVVNWAQSALFSRERKEITTFGDTLSHTDFTVWPRMSVHVTKAAYRAGIGLEPTEGNHFVEHYDGDDSGLRSLTEIGFCMLHFPMRSLEQVRRKLVDGVRGLDAARHSQTTGEHWRSYHRHYETHGQAALEGILYEHINGCL